MGILTLQYSTGIAWQSEVIRRVCHSPFSHVDIVIPGVGLLGASGPDKSSKMLSYDHVDSLHDVEFIRSDGAVIVPDAGGVQIRPFDPWPYKEPPKTISIDTGLNSLDQAVIDTARSQIGKPFDNAALYDFLSSSPGVRDWRANDAWFCSELVIWTCETVGLWPYRLLTPKNRITPADSLMMFNSLMTEADIATFMG